MRWSSGASSTATWRICRPGCPRPRRSYTRRATRTATSSCPSPGPCRRYVPCHMFPYPAHYLVGTRPQAAALPPRQRYPSLHCLSVARAVQKVLPCHVFPYPAHFCLVGTDPPPAAALPAPPPTRPHLRAGTLPLGWDAPPLCQTLSSGLA